VRGVAALVAVCIVAPYAYAAVEDDLRDGDKFFDAGDWRRAAAAYDRAITKAPGQVAAEAYGKRAAIYIILKDYAGGLAFVHKAKLRYPSAPELLEQEALLLWETDKKDAAVAVAEAVVKARPVYAAHRPFSALTIALGFLPSLRVTTSNWSAAFV
jgi:tetratricopeptide (TPR) repeat protein